MPQFSHLTHILEQTQSRFPNKPALSYKVGNEWQSLTYKQFFESVIHFANGLLFFELAPLDRIAVLSNNRPEWAIADLGLLRMGATSIPLYPSLSPSEIAYIINDTKAKAIIIESSEHLEIIKSIRDDCPSLEKLIFIDETITYHKEHAVPFSHILKRGTDHPNGLGAITSPNRESLASIVYTSGTTGLPKGVMLSHGNFLSNVEDVANAIPLNETDSVLSFLPLSHVFERTAGYYIVIAAGGTIHYAESMEKVSDNIKEVRPTVINAVPRFFEKIHEKITGAHTRPIKSLFKLTTRLNHQHKHEAPLTGFKYFLLSLLRKIVIQKIHQKTGGRIRFFVSGGAPLNPKVAQFFDDLDLTIIQGYGLTETAPIISCNRLTQNKPDTVGLPLKQVQVRLGDQNELQVTGPNVMKGYLNLPDQTAAAFTSDGWLHTGDIAEIDSEGFIKIVDRLKELIILSNGKNIAPAYTERLLINSPYISQAVAIGNNRHYLTALIVPNFARLKQEAFCPNEPETDLIKNPTIHAFFESEIDKTQHDLARFEKVKKFYLLTKELTQENGDLTPTLKVKRRIVEQKFREQIATLYSQ